MDKGAENRSVDWVGNTGQGAERATREGSGIGESVDLICGTSAKRLASHCPTCTLVPNPNTAVICLPLSITLDITPQKPARYDITVSVEHYQSDPTGFKKTGERIKFVATIRKLDLSKINNCHTKLHIQPTSTI